ncbi:glycosyltransferase family A protein [Ekhidna sp.]|uniref:glycosyltransferase family A protein n=1 Tax=Ekhidna sp. TaxID=2608089 RepID=UPI003B5CD588
MNSIFNQSHTSFEVIVVDDGSTDRSGEIVQSFQGVRYFKTKNQGVGAARNLAIRHSNHPLVAFIDQDDLWPTNSLMKRIQYLASTPHANLVIGKQKWFLDGLSEAPDWVRTHQMGKELDGYLLGCTLIKKKLFKKYGDFDPTFRFAGDFDWFFRLLDSDEIIHQIEDVVLEKRIHKNNETHKVKESLKDLSRALFRSIQRKRNK